MANITRFDPFAELAPFNSGFVKGLMLQPFFKSLEMEPQIRVDVSEDDKAYTVKAEIPGVNKEDIKVSIDGNLVSISAEVKKESEEKEGKKLIRSERYYGKLYRAFSLAQDVDQEQARARYENGVLELTLPKRAAASTRRLTVQ